MLKVQPGSLVIVKPNKTKEYEKYTHKLMGVEEIQNGKVKTSWLDDSGKAHYAEIPACLLWRVDDTG